jgi:uncharacterized membrane protein
LCRTPCQDSAVFTTLDPPGSNFTVAEGINSRGDIVGLWSTDSFPPATTHGFFLSGGVYTTIDVPGATSTQIFSINATGQIVGQYNDAAGNTHGFFGTPEHPLK